MRHFALLVGLLASTAACGSSPNGDSTSTGGALPGTGGEGAVQTGGAPTGGVSATGGSAMGGGMTGGTTGATSSGGASLGGTSPTGGAVPTGGVTTGGASVTGGAPAGGTPPSGGTGGAAAGTGGQAIETGGSGAGGAAVGGQAGSTAGGSQTGGATGDGGTVGSCVGEPWPTADPESRGPFQWTADKNVGPLAGYTPDPIYGDQQQRFNVYRPENLADSGYCHPILVWSNGHTDNPEQNPPECVVNSATNQWCGTYPTLIEHLASQGFVVIASLSTTTSREDPATGKLPSIVGLDWLLEQAEDSSSPYYHHLDTTHIGALGHSEGGMATCLLAPDPRISVIATVSGTRTLSGLNGPALFICGGQDTVVSCDSVKSTYSAVTDQEAMWMDNLSADHGGWLYQNGAKGPTIFALAAWFRVHLMDDTENRKYFYGDNCTLCTDSRVTVERNSLMTQ